MPIDECLDKAEENGNKQEDVKACFDKYPPPALPGKGVLPPVDKKKETETKTNSSSAL